MDFTAFDSAAVLSYAANADGLGGTLTVTEGADAIAINLVGQYATGGFTTTYQQDHGLLVNYDEGLLI